MLCADDSLVCFISSRGDYLHLRAPIVWPDELESEDIRSEISEDADFYREEIEQFSYFLEANRYAGPGRGSSACFDRDLEAITLSSRVLGTALTENGLEQMIYSLFMAVLKLRLELFPAEVDPDVAELVMSHPRFDSLGQLGDFMRNRV